MGSVGAPTGHDPAEAGEDEQRGGEEDPWEVVVRIGQLGCSV